MSAKCENVLVRTQDLPCPNLLLSQLGHYCILCRYTANRWYQLQSGKNLLVTTRCILLLYIIFLFLFLGGKINFRKESLPPAPSPPLAMPLQCVR